MRKNRVDNRRRRRLKRQLPKTLMEHGIMSQTSIDAIIDELINDIVEESEINGTDFMKTKIQQYVQVVDHVVEAEKEDIKKEMDEEADFYDPFGLGFESDIDEEWIR